MIGRVTRGDARPGRPGGRGGGRRQAVSRHDRPGGGLRGGPAFLLGVALHPARHGEGIRAAGGVYGITHGVMALGLLLQALCLVSVYALNAHGFGRRGAAAFLAATAGTLLWFGLIVVDGTRNPRLARYAPGSAHTPADVAVARVVLPALLLFPLGYVMLGRLLARYRPRWPGVLLAGGAVLYVLGGMAIFALGPHSPVIQVVEVAGAVPYALGHVLLGRAWGRA